MSLLQKASVGFFGLSEHLKKISYNKIRFVLFLISGVLTGLTLVLPKIGFIEWGSLIPVGAVLLIRAADKNVRLRSLYLDGLVFFYTYYIVCFHWFVYLYPLDFIYGMTKLAAFAVVVVALFGLPLLQALMGGLLFVLVALVVRSRLFERIRLSILPPLAIAGSWAVYEWTQTLGWWGVPWGRLPLGQIEYLAGVQNAAWFGSYFITFMIVAVNLLLAMALINPPKIRLGVIVALSLLIFQYASGALIWFATDIYEGEKIKVSCIQGNVSSNEKWDSASLTKTFQNYVGYTKAAANEGAELVIWPETAFPYDISSGLYSMYGDVFAKLADDYDIYLLVGAFTSDEEGNDLNSLVCYTPDGEKIENVYSKRRLVPFGEYVPMREVVEVLVPPLADLVMSTSDIYPGEGAQIMEIRDGIGLGGLVCFDSIYDELTLESVREGADLLCLSTNDSWFVDSKALYIHNAHAQLRAIESGRYVARAANTGISTAITPRGEVTALLEPLVEGKLTFDVYARTNSTPWSIIGNTFVYVLILIYSVFVADAFILKLIEKIRHKFKK